ncbi:MAG: CaiB/BaiF CoA transferase family protein [Methyloligellaceae bacterium]
MPFEPASDILSNFTVLDLTRVRSGPTAVRQLADWGADVIKIEMPETDTSGGMGGPRQGPDFQNLHRNKRSLTLNLKDPSGLEIFKKLVRKADIVVENYRPDVKDRLSIDYESLADINDRIILASISGFGQSGTLAGRPGFDQIAQGMGGLMSITGEPGRGPMRVGIPIADLTAGLFCSQAMLLALLEREKSGKGQWVQTSLLQAQVFMLDFQAARWLMNAEIPGQAGNNHPTSIPTGVFETNDGFMNIAITGGAIWERFKKVMDSLEFEHEDYNTGEKRSDNRDALNALINGHMRQKTTAEWIEILSEAGCPCGEINNIKEVFELDQVQELGLARDVTSHERGQTQIVGQPITMNRSRSEIVKPSPLLGQDAEEILKDLGYNNDEIIAFREKSVI